MAEPATKPGSPTVDEAIAARLIETSRLAAQIVERAQRIAAEQGEGLGPTLVKLGLISERELAQAYAETLALPLIAAEDYPQAPILEGRVSPRFLREERLLPLADAGNHVVVAAADPADRSALSALQIALGKPITLRVGVPAEIEGALDRLYGSERASVTDIVSSASGAGDIDDGDIDRLRDLASEAPVVRLVNHLIVAAAERGASDIHIEPYEHSHRVRYRIDGSLTDVEAPPKQYHAAIVSRIKILAHLDIAERRRPQDGRINISFRGRPIDVRVSIVPTLHGESVVLRLLNRETTALGMSELGFSPATAKTIARLIEEPNGIVLVTGPTGSGKTTTLYAMLAALNSPDRKIITVEDPVEYQIEGINQIQAQAAIGLDFANILRSVLRQNPDIIMIGEIRDAETAEIAVQAALTGHLVLSTLHTNDAASSVTRLVDMGVPEYLVAHTVVGIVAQRLVKRICPKCRHGERIVPELAQRLHLERFAVGAGAKLYTAPGCTECQGRGTIGRIPIGEALAVSPAIRRHILSHADAKEIEHTAITEGMERMADDGVRKALAGEATLTEILRVTRL